MALTAREQIGNNNYVTDADGRIITVNSSIGESSTATVTSVASSASSVQLLAANPARTGATIFNESSSGVYVKLGTTASATSYTVALPPGSATNISYYEVPFGYTGKIDAIWVSANGSARITELSS